MEMLVLALITAAGITLTMAWLAWMDDRPGAGHGRGVH
jgi:hypothetical protein